MEVKSVLVFMVKKVPKEDPYIFISVIVPDSVQFVKKNKNKTHKYLWKNANCRRREKDGQIHY